MSIKLEVGSGGQRLDSTWTTVDIRAIPGVDIVCSAWAIPKESGSVDMIRSRHMIEHLTFQEAKQALKEWVRLLKPGGMAEIICPDREFHIRQVFGLGMNPGHQSPFGPWTNREHGMAGLHGWQNNPHDVHKWSWTDLELIYEMQEAGFSKVTEVDDRRCDVHVIGEK